MSWPHRCQVMKLMDELAPQINNIRGGYEDKDVTVRDTVIKEYHRLTCGVDVAVNIPQRTFFIPFVSLYAHRGILAAQL
ncbi:hypothetical protein VNO77_16475 [Canavalia gladiata]|uniref:Uncharacterized protein n=1 Tax=Canavalia gladiata TaxID=3824 RepID=A0AAN9M5X2_CANGL